VRKETGYLLKTRSKVVPKDFHKLKVIGKGAYGTVYLVTKKESSGALYAMKVAKKDKMAGKGVLERDILKEMANSSPWVVKLYYAFKDTFNLYYVMEFLQGGDFLTLLIEQTTLSEDATRFYMAELLTAVNSIHEPGYLHRYNLLCCPNLTIS
jgi:protein-serine/threonine kinase